MRLRERSAVSDSRSAFPVGPIAAGVFFATLFGAGLVARSARADVEAPNDDDKRKALMVSGIMEQAHLNRRPIDDTISTRLHEQFLKALDPMKLYFLQEDADEFAKRANEHDDRRTYFDLDFPFLVYQRFLKRVDQRSEWVQKEFADKAYDFNQQTEIVVDPKATTYAKDEQEAKQRWDDRVKYELATLMVNGEKEAEARERIKRRYRNIGRRWHEMDADELVEIYLTSLTNSFDPHSSYMSPRTVEDFNIAIQLSLEGIGALLSSEDGLTIVKEVVPGGAADKDGRLKPGDKIVGVGEGDQGEMVDLLDMKLKNVVKLIRGKAGTTLRLEVIPANTEKHEVYALTRQKIELQDGGAKGEVIELDGEAGMPKVKVGVIKLPSFYADSQALQDGDENAKSASHDVRKILEDFKAQGVQGVVMDLRNNGGGLLNEAIMLTGLFIEEGPVVQVRDFSGRVFPYRDEFPGVAYDGPLVVLISKFSASASEIFAGAIKDYGRGIVVGDSSTHGKGTVQKVLDLGRQAQQLPGNNNLGAVKLTMQQFYRVNGMSTQNQGVSADIVLPSPSDHEDFGEAKLDYALASDQINHAMYLPMGNVVEATIAKLREASAKRLETDETLQKLKEKKERIHERRNRATLVFNEASLKRDREEFKEFDDEDALDGDEHASDPDAPPGEPGAKKKKDKKFGADPYTQEVLHIMADFIRLDKESHLTSN